MRNDQPHYYQGLQIETTKMPFYSYQAGAIKIGNTSVCGQGRGPQEFPCSCHCICSKTQVDK